MSKTDNRNPSPQGDGISKPPSGQRTSAAALNNLGKTQFELLSAYMDGEVSSSERRQVEHWLETDTKVKCLYSRLIKLRNGMRAMPIPASERSVEETLERVCQKADRRPKLVLAWVGAAAAVVAASVFSGNPGLRFSPAFLEKEPEQIEQIDPKVITEETIPRIKDTLGAPVTGVVEDTLESSDQLILEIDKPVVEVPEVEE